MAIPKNSPCRHLLRYKLWEAAAYMCGTMPEDVKFAEDSTATHPKFETPEMGACYSLVLDAVDYNDRKSIADNEYHRRLLFDDATADAGDADAGDADKAVIRKRYRELVEKISGGAKTLSELEEMDAVESADRLRVILEYDKADYGRILDELRQERMLPPYVRQHNMNEIVYKTAIVEYFKCHSIDNDFFTPAPESGDTEDAVKKTEPLPEIPRIRWIAPDNAFAEMVAILRKKGYISYDSDTAAFAACAPHFDSVNTAPDVLRIGLLRKMELSGGAFPAESIPRKEDYKPGAFDGIKPARARIKSGKKCYVTNT